MSEDASLPLARAGGSGQYEILGRLREGGMGAIYLVRHRHLDELRVIKVLRPGVADDEEGRRRFHREALVATRLRHANIAITHDFIVSEDGTALLIMEFVPGCNLRELLRGRGPVPPPLALNLAAQALSALGHLHRRGVVHRDVSPENLMLTRTHEGLLVKLIDLGIAKSFVAPETLTSAGLFIGKIRYGAPEQFTGATSLDGRADLYAMGIVLHELLTGMPPFRAAGIEALLSERLNCRPLTLRESWPGLEVPDGLEDVLAWVLEREPAGRPSTAEEFAAALWRLPVARPGEVAFDVAARTYLGPFPQEGPPELASPVSVASSARRRLEGLLSGATPLRSGPESDESVGWTPRTDVESWPWCSTTQEEVMAVGSDAPPRPGNTAPRTGPREEEDPSETSSPGTDAVGAARCLPGPQPRDGAPPPSLNFLPRVAWAVGSILGISFLGFFLGRRAALPLPRDPGPGVSLSLPGRPQAETRDVPPPGSPSTVPPGTSDTVIAPGGAREVSKVTPTVPSAPIASPSLGQGAGGDGQAPLRETRSPRPRTSRENRPSGDWTDVGRPKEGRPVPAATPRELLERAREGNLHAVEALLAAGVPPDAADESGDTALHLAGSRGDVELASALLSAGAPWRPRNRAGLQPLHRAAIRGHTNVARLLLDAGADREAADPEGSTPLVLAAGSRAPNLVTLLLQRGARPDAANKSGVTALMVAVDRRDLRTVLALLEARPDAEAQNARGLTALMIAAGVGDGRIARALVDHGARPEARGRAGFSAVEIAEQRGHPDLARFLREYRPAAPHGP